MEADIPFAAHCQQVPDATCLPARRPRHRRYSDPLMGCASSATRFDDFWKLPDVTDATSRCDRKLAKETGCTTAQPPIGHVGVVEQPVTMSCRSRSVNNSSASSVNPIEDDWSVDDALSFRLVSSDESDELLNCDSSAFDELDQECVSNCEDLVEWEPLPYRAVPQWLQDNEWLMNGHRPQLENFHVCFWSMFRIHTQTLNVWTHLIGCMLFLALNLRIVEQHNFRWQERVVISTYLTAVTTCFWISSNFHLFQCHSKEIGKFFSRLDYCGIILVIGSSTAPWIYFTFHCRPIYQLAYLAITFLACSSCILIMFLIHDRISHTSETSSRTCMFIGLTLAGALTPSLHYTALVGISGVLTNTPIQLLAASNTAYLIGVWIYCVRFPECRWPGKFDIFMSSHQIFHLFTLIGTYINYRGLLLAAATRLELGACYQSTGRR